jgi:tight adherence protein B
MTRRVASLLGATALVVLTALPAAATEKLVVDSVDLTDLPTVSMLVTLPPSMAGIRPSAEDFAVIVDGTRPRLDVYAAVNAPLEVVLLLDTSGSMAGEPMEQARRAASEFVDAMPGTASVTVIAFGDAVSTVAGPDDDAAGAIEALRASGETALYDAVLAATRSFAPDGGTRRVMIILSDGGDTISGSSLEEATEAAAGSGAEVHGVALTTSESDLTALEALSTETVVTAEAATELSDRYAELAVALTGRYRLQFSSHAAGTTAITVLVNGPGGVTSTAVSVDFPSPDAPSTGRTVVARPPVVTPESITPVTIGAPGRLGLPWALPAGIALVFGGTVATLWLTLRHREDDRPPVLETPVEDRSVPSGPLSVLASRVRSLGDRFAERDRGGASIDTTLDRAGVDLRPGEFVVVSATGIVVLTLVGVTLAGALGAIVLGGAAAMGPRTVLRLLAQRRQRAFADQLEGSLQIIAGSLRAGYGLTQSMATVAEESPQPTAREFDRVVVENRLGRSVEQSMEAMADRMENEDLGWVVEAIKIQHEVGGDLAEVLDTVTSTIRDRNQIKRQVKALSAEGRISAIILLALPFVIAAFIAMITPDYLAELTTTTMGRIMLGAAMVLMGAGAAWIRKIVKVDF